MKLAAICLVLFTGCKSQSALPLEMQLSNMREAVCACKTMDCARAAAQDLDGLSHRMAKKTATTSGSGLGLSTEADPTSMLLSADIMQITYCLDALEDKPKHIHITPDMDFTTPTQNTSPKAADKPKHLNVIPHMNLSPRTEPATDPAAIPSPG